MNVSRSQGDSSSPGDGGVDVQTAIAQSGVQPSAGWYPHPDEHGWEAYWSGTAWSRDVRPCNAAAEESGSPRVLIACIIGFCLSVFAVAAPFLPGGWIDLTGGLFLGVGTFSLVGIAGLTVAVLRIQGTAAAIAAALVVAAATTVAISLGLSLFDAYTRPAVIAGQLIFLAFAAIAWSLTGRPRLLIRLPSTSELRKAAKAHPALAAILVALLFATWIEAVLALGVVPNNYDSMFYHLSRIGYWMQNDSVLQFYGGTVFQLQHPPNAEILQAWTMELTQGDRFAQYIQWWALLGLICTVFAGARLLGFARAESLFASAIFGTLPLVILEASSTQNDLVAAFFVCASALFLVRAVAGSRLGDAFVGALALGIAVGTKGTVLLALPGLALLMGAALWWWRPASRFVAVGAALLITGVLVLGAPNYLQTTLNTGSPIGDAGSVKRRTEPLPESAFKTMSGFVDFPGRSAIPPLADLLVRGERVIWGGETEGVSTSVDVHEDFTGFGPVGLLLICLLLGVLAARSRKDRRLLAGVALSYIALFLAFVTAQPFDMRLMVIPIALGAPLLAYLGRDPLVRCVTVVVVVVFMVPVLFTNQQKPLSPKDFSLANDPATQRGGWNENYDEMLRNTDQALADDQRVGFVGTPLDWDYPLFGPHLDRFVVRLPELSTWPEAMQAMQFYGLDSIVWAVQPPPDSPAELVNRPDPPWKATSRWITRDGPSPGGKPTSNGPYSRAQPRPAASSTDDIASAAAG